PAHHFARAAGRARVVRRPGRARPGGRRHPRRPARAAGGARLPLAAQRGRHGYGEARRRHPPLRRRPAQARGDARPAPGLKPGGAGALAWAADCCRRFYVVAVAPWGSWGRYSSPLLSRANAKRTSLRAMMTRLWIRLSPRAWLAKCCSFQRPEREAAMAAMYASRRISPSPFLLSLRWPTRLPESRTRTSRPRKATNASLLRNSPRR